MLSHVRVIPTEPLSLLALALASAFVLVAVGYGAGELRMAVLLWL